MRKGIFKRPGQMAHNFGELEGDNSFDFPVPSLIGASGSRPVTPQRDGEESYPWREAQSPVVKPNGVKADKDGPEHQPEAIFALHKPVSRGRRK